MSIKDDLEIILITYNRKTHLQSTFEQIFSDNSPVKDFGITILDNKSTDGTSELIQEYARKFRNIKHIIHNRNIGGNANIARAFEIASKKYVWILCDDDEYDFTCWPDVENAIKENYDGILVSNYLNPSKNLAQLVKQMTFVPSTIYKTENFDKTTMINTEFCINSMFPQLAAACCLINKKKRIKILDKWIVNMVPNAGFDSYTRGLDNFKHPYMQQIFWEVGFINAVQLIQDKQKRDFIIENMGLNEENFFSSMIGVFTTNNNKFFEKSKKNLHDVWCGINSKQKIVFILAFIFYRIPIRIYYTSSEKKLWFKIFNLKTRIIFKRKSKK